MKHGLPWQERFLARVEMIPFHSCWEWVGAKQLGYGTFNIAGKNYRTHRISYELFKGKIPEGLCLDHLCRNRGCVNPDHLEAVTLKENTLRSPIAPTAICARVKVCPKGHEYSGENLQIRIKSDSRPHRICRECQRAMNRKCDRKRRNRMALKKLELRLG